MVAYESITAAVSVPPPKPAHADRPTADGVARVGGALSQRVRVNVAKTATKGYTHETTVEVSCDGDDPGLAMARLATLLGEADAIARNEIAAREAADRRDGGGL